MIDTYFSLWESSEFLPLLSSVLVVGRQLQIGHRKPSTAVLQENATYRIKVEFYKCLCYKILCYYYYADICTYLKTSKFHFLLMDCAKTVYGPFRLQIVISLCTVSPLQISVVLRAHW